MKKDSKEKTKQKKPFTKNKLKKVLHPNNAKPISIESNTGDAKILKKHIQKISNNKNRKPNSNNTNNRNNRRKTRYKYRLT